MTRISDLLNLNHLDIPFIKGDGIGPEISAATEAILHASIKKCYGDSRSLSFIDAYAGEAAFKSVGDWLPKETVELIRKKGVALKGPLTTPIGKGERSINVRLRKELDLYACIRPVKHFPNVPCPVKRDVLDIVIFRENTEDVYRGIEYKAGSEEAIKLARFLTHEFGADLPSEATTAIGIKPMSIEGSKRISRAAIRYALELKRKKVSLIHKGNIMKFTEGMFRDVGYDVAEEEFSDSVYTMRQYQNTAASDGTDAANKALDAAKAAGKVIIDDVIADAGLMHMTMHPERFDVLILSNLNGDYYSDSAAGVVGGLGVAPGANVNFETHHGLFEATHGTAPDIAGKDLANPTSLLLSACMLLDYIQWFEAAQAIRKAINACFEAKILTADLAPKDIKASSCSAFSQAVLERL
jgi:isocitrate dehydrogenase